MYQNVNTSFFALLLNNFFRSFQIMFLTPVRLPSEVSKRVGLTIESRKIALNKSE
jgi:hypothetical protein